MPNPEIPRGLPAFKKPRNQFTRLGKMVREKGVKERKNICKEKKLQGGNRNTAESIGLLTQPLNQAFNFGMFPPWTNKNGGLVIVSKILQKLKEQVRGLKGCN